MKIPVKAFVRLKMLVKENIKTIIKPIYWANE